MGFNGCKDIPTPNIDRLAESGIQFTSGYVLMPYCAPSRAGIISGRHPVTFGFLDNPNPILANDQGLPPGTTTAGAYLQKGRVLSLHLRLGIYGLCVVFLEATAREPLISVSPLLKLTWRFSKLLLKLVAEVIDVGITNFISYFGNIHIGVF